MELFSNIIHEVRIFSVFFPTLAITVRVIKVMISGIAFDRLAFSHAFLGELVWETIDHPDRLRRLRSFPYDRFKIYTVVLIVHIELNYILSRDYKGNREGIPHIHPIPQVIRLELFLTPQISRGIRQQPIT